MIAGFERQTAGSVMLHGQDVTPLPPYDRDVDTVFQDYALELHRQPLWACAAGDLGARPGRIFRTVVVPLPFPAIAAG